MLSIMQTLLPRIKEIGDNGPGGEILTAMMISIMINHEDASEDNGEDHVKERSRRKIGPLVKTPKTEVSNDILSLRLQKGFHYNLK